MTAVGQAPEPNADTATRLYRGLNWGPIPLGPPDLLTRFSGFEGGTQEIGGFGWEGALCICFVYFQINSDFW